MCRPAPGRKETTSASKLASRMEEHETSSKGNQEAQTKSEEEEYSNRQRFRSCKMAFKIEENKNTSTGNVDKTSCRKKEDETSYNEKQGVQTRSRE